MPRLTQEERDEVIKLSKEGKSNREIGRRFKTSGSTVSRLLERYEATGSTEDRPRAGRPKILPKQKNTWYFCKEADRPFVCTLCAKTFSNFSGLKRHLQNHEGVIQCQCDQCGKTCSSSSSLKRHLRCHTGEKPFMCEYCARGFRDQNTLRVHIRTHTKERPFPCHLCEHRASSAGNLHSHMKKHRDRVTGEVPWPVCILPKDAPTFMETDLLEKIKKGEGEDVSKEHINDSIIDSNLSSLWKPKSSQAVHKEISSSGKVIEKVVKQARSETDVLPKRPKYIPPKKKKKFQYTYEPSGNGGIVDCTSGATFDIGKIVSAAAAAAAKEYEVLIKTEPEEDISQRVGQIVNSEMTRLSEVSEDQSKPVVVPSVNKRKTTPKKFTKWSDDEDDIDSEDNEFIDWEEAIDNAASGVKKQEISSNEIEHSQVVKPNSDSDDYVYDSDDFVHDDDDYVCGDSGEETDEYVPIPKVVKKSKKASAAPKLKVKTHPKVEKSKSQKEKKKKEETVDKVDKEGCMNMVM